MATKYDGKMKRPFKQQITDGIAEIVNMTTNRSQILLCLPSIKQLDIKAFQKAGYHNTFIIFVEGGDASVSNIMRKIKELREKDIRLVSTWY